MIKGIIYKYLAKAVVVLLLGLILFGIFPGTGLAIVLSLVVLLRFFDLCQQGVSQRKSEENPILIQQSPKPPLLKPQFRPTQPRSIRELLADGMGVIAFAIFLPMAFALYTNEIFSLERQQGWREALVAFGCIALYVCPHVLLKAPAQAHLRIMWWTIPFFIGLFLVPHLVETRHPYLNPANPDRNRLAAERVLTLKNNVVSGYYAGWITRYAEDVETHGDTQQAIRLYEESLRREPNQPGAAQRLKTLLAKNSDLTPPLETPKQASPNGPYWTNFSALEHAARHPVDNDLENVPSCTVVILPFEGVDDKMLDAIAFVVHQELQLPVYIAPNRIPLPPYSRKRGLATNPQWQTDVIFSAFTNSVTYFPKAPIKFLVVTSADIYMEQSAYVFSQAFPWGALLSSARFGDATQAPEIVAQRTAKQSLCALIKSFGVPPSLDPNCVTSYSNGPQEFDAKGNRPNAETWSLFQKALAEINRGWAAFRARR